MARPLRRTGPLPILLPPSSLEAEKRLCLDLPSLHCSRLETATSPICAMASKQSWCELHLGISVGRALCLRILTRSAERVVEMR
eukprot:6175064-Pleurochrysis_carterae.AAC.2